MNLHRIILFISLIVIYSPRVVGQQSVPREKIILKEKHLVKSIKIKSDEKLVIRNTFGDVRVATWNKNEVNVQVIMSGRSALEKRSQFILDNIIIDEKILENGSDSIVFNTTVKTPYNSNNGVNGILYPVDGDHGDEATVDYIIYIPKDMALDIRNIFGDVFITDYSGPLRLYLSHGDYKPVNVTGIKNIYYIY